MFKSFFSSLPSVARSILRAGLLLLLLPALLPTSSRAQAGAPSFALREGDRVVFYGDSITAQRLYTKYIEESILARYPGMHIDFFNAGMGGDRVSGGGAGTSMERLNRDVVPFHPTVVTMMLGMNDGGYTPDFDKHFEAYSKGYRALVSAFQAELPGARFTLIAPSPYDELAHAPLITGYNQVLIRYGNFVESLAKEKGFEYVDFNQPVTAGLSLGLRQNAILTAGFVPDRVHPSDQGHWMLAAALLRAWHFSPIVSSVTVDMARGEATARQNTTISDIARTKGDGALPLPLEMRDPSIQLVVKAADLSSLDQQILRATGLAGARYTLRIDGLVIDSFSREELEDGVNLALIETPMLYQARSIDWAGSDRAQLNATRFNMNYQGTTVPNAAAAVEALNQLDIVMVQKERGYAQPKPHVFELVAE
jgi:lysophospholipase L1-like esterase